MYLDYNAMGEDPTNTEKQGAVEDEDDNADDDDTQPTILVMVEPTRRVLLTMMSTQKADLHQLDGI
jgi:hypothetical protein